MNVRVLKGQAPKPLNRAAFGRRFRERFADPAFTPESDSIARLEAIAWEAYTEGRKAPVTRRAGPGFADPAYELSQEWYDTHRAIQDAQAQWGRRQTPPRVLIVNASPRNDGTCPGENSKTCRLAAIAQRTVRGAGIHADVLDLSLLASDYDRHIHPCKGCASTAMPLCHWPCSCYPNHATGQVNDWMNELYPRWVAAHGVLIVAPTHWYQSPTPLKAMMDRLVCADGGNPDPTSTQGKRAAEAKRIEQKGWHYPKHLAGRVYGVVVHGDVAGVEDHRRLLCDWLDWMGLIDAGPKARLDRYLGYYEPYYNSHDALDRDKALQAEVRNAAHALVDAVKLLRNGALNHPGAARKPPRPK